MNRLDSVDSAQRRTDIPDFAPGDTVRVHVRIKESETKERLQAFEGVCIARKGDGIRETFTVRKTSFGVGVERGALFLTQLGAGEQVRAVAAGLAERRAASPARDLRVVAAQQDFRHAPAAELDGARVVREVEEPFGEGLVDRRGLAPQSARDEPCDRVHQDDRRGLAAREHVVADGDLVGR